MDPRQALKEYIGNGDVLIVGGAPSAAMMDERYYDGFQTIVRFNNYKKSNDAPTDVFFSYFGRNIRKTQKELKDDGVEFLINKYPNEDMTERFKQEGFTKIQDTDFRWVYELRKDWWFGTRINLTADELFEQVRLLGGIMPTTGFSCIDFFVRTLHIPVEIIGFDCFKSGIHNLNEPWDMDGGHDPQREEELLEKYHKGGLLEWVR